MHAIHHTESFVIKSVPVGEANRRVWLYTRDFGLVVAAVQGVRKNGAKLQSQIAEYALIGADLVRGREVWRLTSASILREVVRGAIRTPRVRAYVRTLSALERFLVGEEPHEALFAHLRECMECALDEGVNAKYLDTLSLWKVLAMLGYVAIDPLDIPLSELPLREAIEQLDHTRELHLREQATRAIKESHL